MGAEMGGKSARARDAPDAGPTTAAAAAAAARTELQCLTVGGLRHRRLPTRHRELRVDEHRAGRRPGLRGGRRRERVLSEGRGAAPRRIGAQQEPAARTVSAAVGAAHADGAVASTGRRL
jgi:hypothetical protein